MFVAVTGVFGKDAVAEAVADAVKKFIAGEKDIKIQHIYVVDINSDMVESLQKSAKTVRQFTKLQKFMGSGPAQLDFQQPRTTDFSMFDSITPSSSPSQVLPVTTYSSTKAAATTSSSASAPASTTTLATASSTASSSSGEECPICFETITQPKHLPCKHTFCKACIDESFAKTKPACPICGAIFGVLKGTQPRGDMRTTTDYRSHLPGYGGCGVIIINYDIPDGYQSVSQLLYLYNFVIGVSVPC